MRTSLVGELALPEPAGLSNSLHTTHVEMLSGRRKKDYEAESSAQALEAQVEANGILPGASADEQLADASDTIAEEVVAA